MSPERVLNSTTPRGLPFIERQHSALNEIARVWGCQVQRTPDATYARVDALLSREGKLIAVVEVKARDCTLAMVHDFGSYLVTFDKLVEGRRLARRLCVGFVLVVDLLDAIVWWRIADARGEWLASMTITRTTTQKNCNGGDVERANAYLDLRDMHRLDEAG